MFVESFRTFQDKMMYDWLDLEASSCHMKNHLILFIWHVKEEIFIRYNYNPYDSSINIAMELHILKWLYNVRICQFVIAVI